MSNIRSKETKIEIAFRKELWQRGFRYSKNSTGYFGKPDLALLKYRTVIFIDSCFWHGCREHCRIPNTRKDYWIKKIERNKKRDRDVSRFYKNQHWQIIRVWEHDMKKPNLIEKIASKILLNAWVKGGTTRPENCEMLCKTHNRAKGNR